jgi:hypothetical protein
MERKEAMLKAGCSRILWAVIAVVLCAAPSVQADVTVLAGQEWDITYDVGGFLNAYGIANLDTGAYAAYGIYAYAGSTLNIRGGTIGAGYSVGVFSGGPAASVTVYGTDFADSSGPISTTQWTPDGGLDTLTVTYTNENGDPIGDPVNLLFYSFIAINLVNTAGGPEPELITVQIDIKPGSDDNTINLGSNGVIPVAILSDSDFDATTVDPVSVSLAGSDVAMRGKGKLLAHEEDVNGDGLPDLVVQVETENLDPGTFQDGAAILTGQTTDGTEFTGSDSITIVPPE